MQFEKEDVGYYRKLFGVRGSALLAEREGEKESRYIDLVHLFLLLEVL